MNNNSSSFNKLNLKEFNIFETKFYYFFPYIFVNFLGAVFGLGKYLVI